MDPMTIAALIQAGIGAAGAIQKGVASAKQNKMAKEYGKTKRPDYQIPPSLTKATDMARANLNPPINTQLLQEIGAGTAGEINRAGKVGTSTADMLAASGNALAQENASKRAMFGDNQSRKDAMLGQYMNMLQTMGGQENKAWDWNKAQPYLNAQEAAQALHQSSAQNASGAIGDLAGGIGAGANSLMQGKEMDMQEKQMQGMMDLLMGKKTGGDAGDVNSLLSDAQKTQKLTAGSELEMAGKPITPLPIPNTSNKPYNPMTTKPTIGNVPERFKPSMMQNIAGLMAKKNFKSDGTDNTLTKGLTEMQLPKVPIQNTNIPVAERILTDPTAPIITTTTTGKVLENGRPLGDKYENINGVVTKNGSVITPKSEDNSSELISSIGQQGVDYAIDNALKAKGYTKEEIAMIRSIGKDGIDYAMKGKTKLPITKSGTSGQPRPKIAQSLGRNLSPALDMILKLMNK